MLLTRCAPLLPTTVLALLAATAAAQPPNPYRTVSNWIMAPAGRELGQMSMIDSDAAGNLWITERCGDTTCVGHSDVAPVLHIGAAGEWLGSFGAGLSPGRTASMSIPTAIFG
jgi:hypothetical protein